MKLITLAILVGTLALVPAVQAQQAQQPEQSDTVSVPVRANDTRIELPDRYRKMWPDQFDRYKGGYTLSNGQTLSIRSLGSNMYAYVDNDRWHKIVAVAPNTFVALDRKLKMEINLLDDGDASGWVTMVLPAQQLSGGGFAPEKNVSFAMR